MKILFDILHPAHVHLFRNFISHLKKNGHEVTVVSRNKDVTDELMTYYNIDHIPITKPVSKGPRIILEQLIRDWKIIRLHRQHKFDMAYGTSASIGLLSLLGKTRSFVFNEDDDSSQPFFCMKSYPFATEIWMPEGTAYYRILGKRRFYNSYHELAYLHPDNFTPDIETVKQYGLEPGKYIVVRRSALDAHHDIGKSGLSGVWDEILSVIKDFPLVMSMEKEKSHQIKPWDVHHILAHAKLVITDSQTMTAESAVLGTPSVRYNSFVRRLHYLDELEDKYHLTYGFRPGNEGGLLSKIEELLGEDKISAFQENKRKMLEEKSNMNKLIVDDFEQYVKKHG